MQYSLVMITNVRVPPAELKQIVRQVLSLRCGDGGCGYSFTQFCCVGRSKISQKLGWLVTDGLRLMRGDVMSGVWRSRNVIDSVGSSGTGASYSGFSTMVAGQNGKWGANEKKKEVIILVYIIISWLAFSLCCYLLLTSKFVGTRMLHIT